MNGEGANERMLFHGTSKESSDKIAAKGFNRSRVEGSGFGSNGFNWCVYSYCRKGFNWWFHNTGICTVIRG